MTHLHILFTVIWYQRFKKDNKKILSILIPSLLYVVCFKDDTTNMKTKEMILKLTSPILGMTPISP